MDSHHVWFGQEIAKAITNKTTFMVFTIQNQILFFKVVLIRCLNSKAL